MVGAQYILRLLRLVSTCVLSTCVAPKWDAPCLDVRWGWERSSVISAFMRSLTSMSVHPCVQYSLHTCIRMYIHYYGHTISSEPTKAKIWLFFAWTLRPQGRNTPLRLGQEELDSPMEPLKDVCYPDLVPEAQWARHCLLNGQNIAHKG